MGVDTMEVPVATGAENQDTNTPLKPTERVASSSEVKQITKAGFRTGNTEGAQKMIDNLQSQDSYSVPPKLELPSHEQKNDPALSNGSSGVHKPGFWDGFDEMFPSKNIQGASVSPSENGHSTQATSEQSTIELKVGKAPEDVWEKQEAKFVDSLKPLAKKEDEKQQDLPESTLDTWQQAREIHEKVKDADEREYRAKLFGSKATLDQFQRQSEENRGKQLDKRDEVLDAVWKPDLKLTEKQKEEIQNEGQKPLDTPEGQRQFYARVQSKEPDRLEPGTTPREKKVAESESSHHIVPEAVAMRTAEAKTDDVYGAWKNLADADRLVAEFQRKQQRMRTFQKVAGAGLIATGVVMGVDVKPVSDSGIETQPGINTASTIQMPEALPSAPIPPEPSPSDLVVPSEKGVNGEAIILNIDHDGDSIGQSANDQKVPGMETPESFKKEYENPLVRAALLDANAGEFIKDNTATQEQIDDIVARLANGDMTAMEDADSILKNIQGGNKILILDKAGFDELEQHFMEKVRQASSKGNVDKATVWIKLHADLVKQKEAAMKSGEPIPYRVMSDEEVVSKKAEQVASVDPTATSNAAEVIPPVTDAVPIKETPPVEKPKNRFADIPLIGKWFR